MHVFLRKDAWLCQNLTDRFQIIKKTDHLDRFYLSLGQKNNVLPLRGEKVGRSYFSYFSPNPEKCMILTKKISQESEFTKDNWNFCDQKGVLARAS